MFLSSVGSYKKPWGHAKRYNHDDDDDVNDDVVDDDNLVAAGVVCLAK